MAGRQPNLPITTGTGLWVAPAGEAAIGLGGGNRIVLGATTELDLDRLDDQALAATQAQGESYLHLRQVPPGENYGVKTPRGIVTIAAPGRYAIVSGDTEHPTLITVLDGAASLTGGPATAEIGPGQALAITGDGAATPSRRLSARPHETRSCATSSPRSARPRPRPGAPPPSSPR